MTVRRSLGISAISQGISFAIQFTSVIVVSRLLTPEEIGIFSVAVALLAFAHIFREFGVAQYLIQARHIDRARLRAAFTVTLTISWTIALLLLLVRHPLANFYRNDGIKEVLAVISINFVILPFGSPLLSLMRREMQFGRLAVVNISNSFVSAIVTIVAALLGASYLSMALGAVAGIITNVVILNIMRPGQIFLMPSFRGVREVIRFGSMSSAVSIMSELGASAPDLILGRTLGFSDVAFYSRANGLRQMALRQVLTLVRGVYFPSFAEKVRQGGNPADIYAQSMVYVVAITAPALAVLAVISEPLITFLFGPQWTRSAPLAALLCASSMLATPTAMAPTSLIASGNIRVVMRTEFIMVCARTAAMATSIWLSLEQVVLLFCVTYVVELITYLFALWRIFHLSPLNYIKRLRQSLLLVPCATAGPALIWYFQNSALINFSSLLILATSGLTAAAVWLAGVYLLDHPLSAEIRRAWLRATRKDA